MTNEEREALENIAGYAETARRHTKDAHILSFLGEIEGWARSALSRPSRNCELYATYTEAAEAHEKYYTAYIMRASNKFDSPLEFDKWLFAPAEKREETQGGDK